MMTRCGATEHRSIPASIVERASRDGTLAKRRVGFTRTSDVRACRETGAPCIPRIFRLGDTDHGEIQGADGWPENREINSAF